MISLGRKDALKRQAAASSADAKKTAQLARTAQIARSTIEAGEDTVIVSDLLTESVHAIVAVEDHELTLEAVDPGIETTDDAWNAADDTHVVHMAAIDNLIAVQEAQAAADQAIENAANAQTTADGKNARRRGQTEPDAPDGGWQQGDQWVVDNADGKAVEVRVWNGTEFVPEQILASELLVVGGDGNVRIKDGMVTAAAIAAEFYYGRTFIGGQFIGGRFELSDIEEILTVWADDCETINPDWRTWHTSTVSLSSSAHEGTKCLEVNSTMPLGNERGIEYSPASPLGPGDRFTVWLWAETATAVTVMVWPHNGFAGEQVFLAAGVWTKHVIELGPDPVQDVAFWVNGPIKFRVDDIRIESDVEITGSGLKMYRDPTGLATLETIADGYRTRVAGGAILMDMPDSPGAGTQSLSPAGFVSSDSDSRMQIRKDSSAPGTGIDIVAGSSPSNTTRILMSGNGRELILDGLVETPGHVFDTFALLNMWSPIDGTCARVGSTYYERRNGGWVRLTGEATGFGTIMSGWSLNSAEMQRAGQLMFIRVSVSRTGGTITVPASGDIANTAIFTISNSDTYPVFNVPLATVGAGRVAAGYLSSANGNVVLTSVAGSGNITNGENFELGGFYLRKPFA